MKKTAIILTTLLVTTSFSTQAETLEEAGKMTFREFCSAPNQNFNRVLNAVVEDYGDRHQFSEVIGEVASRFARICMDNQTNTSVCEAASLNVAPRKLRTQQESYCNSTLNKLFINDLEKAARQKGMIQ